MKLYDFYKNGYYTDVVLQVQEESLSVHGIILSSISEYFQVMLQSGFRESSTKTIDFSSSFQNMTVLKNVIDYMYTGKIYLRKPILEQVLGAAHLFLLNRLKEHCAQFLLEQLKPQNALWTWRLAYLYDMAELEVVCQSFLLTVFSRHLVDQTDMRPFTPDCLSALFNCDELMQTLDPKDVSYLVVAWLKAGDYESRKELAKSLLLKYLKDQALDIILESIYNLSSNRWDISTRELGSTIPNFVGKISWIRSQETEQKTPPTSAFSPHTHNGLLVREQAYDGLSFFCREKNKWSFDTFHNIGHTPLGIIESNYLVSVGKDIHTIYTTNLKTKTVAAPASILRTITREGRVVNPGKEATHYFMHLGYLYALVNLSVRSTSDLIFSIYRFEVVINWKPLLDITQELDNSFFPEPFSRDDICVKLNSVPHDDSSVFIIVRLSLETTPNFGTWNIDRLNDTPSDGQGYQKSTFYLYKVNPCEESYTLLSTTSMYLSNARLDNAFFFKQKICFPGEKIEKWTLFDSLKLQCISYCLSSSSWCQEDLTLPSPVVEPLPLKREDFPSRSVKVQGSLLYAGVHQAPHIFNVYVFDFQKFEWQKLPTIPSASISPLSLYPITARRPVNHYFTSETGGKQIDNSKYFFLNTSLVSWKGNRIK